MTKKTIAVLKKARKYYRATKTSEFVKKYYKENKNKDIKYLRNIWNRNFYWDFFFQSMPNSIKSNEYVPHDFYGYKIESTFNDEHTALYVKDKNMYDRIFGNFGVKLPKTIFRCYNHIFMDESYTTIEDIGSFVKNIKQDIIVKQANYLPGGGEGVEKYVFSKGSLINSSDGKHIDVDALKANLEGNFIVQEIVQQHPQLAKYHPSSLNTIKVYSYRSVKTNKIEILMATFRTGGNNSFLDNASNGGLMVGLEIDEFNEAKLKEYGFDKWGNHSSKQLDTNTSFKDNEIPNFPEIIKAIEKLSNLVPYQRLIGWDFSLNEKGEPVFIELNIGSGVWGMQVANGKPVFGEFTAEIKDYIT
jgi:hypothetical protein